MIINEFLFDFIVNGNVQSMELQQEFLCCIRILFDIDLSFVVSFESRPRENMAQ